MPTHAPSAERLRSLLPHDAIALLDHPEVNALSVSFDVVDGQLGEPRSLQVSMRTDAVPSSVLAARAVKRTGYDAGFLAHQVPLPRLSQELAPDALVVDGSPAVHYTHFSLTMSRSRRFARWVAWNVDGSALRKLSRSSMKFRLDPRLPAEAQVDDELYAGNRIDRGHVARRADLTWGSAAEAQQANSDSFYFTNITPQVDDFNQSRRAGVWGRIEDSVYEQVEVQDLRISVLGGPVLREDDPVYRGVALPREFWKVVTYVEAGQLKAQAFLLTQQLDRLEVLHLDEFRAYQVTVADLGERTGIDFGEALLTASTTLPPALRAAAPLESTDDISW